MGDSRMTNIRLPLQIGTSSLWSIARSSVLFPGLVLVGIGVWAFIALLDMDKVGFAVGGAIAGAGGCLLYYAYKHIKLALEERPSDVVLDHQGLRVEGGARDGLALAWSEIDPKRCRVEDATEERFVLWRVVTNIPLLAISIVGEADLTLGFTEKTPIKRLWVARHQGEEMLVAEGDLPIEEESLETLMRTIRSSHWYGQQQAVPAGPRAIVCRNCGATVPPAAEHTVACVFCNTPIAMPEDVRARVAAAKNLASARHAGFARLTRLLESQPSATRASVAIALAAIPIALAWPIAAIFILRDWEWSGAGGVRFLQLITFPILLTFGAFLLARGRLTDRFALHAVVVGFGAHDPARPGEPYRCRACEAALPPVTGTPIVRCIYCNQASVIGLDLRREAHSAQEEQQSLEDALSRRTRERWLWTAGSLLSLVLLAGAIFALRGTFSLHRLPKKAIAATVSSAKATTTTTATATATATATFVDNTSSRFPAITRKLTVKSKSGPVPFSTAGGCSLSVLALTNPEHCRAYIKCDTTTIYGSSTSWMTCESTSSGPLTLEDPDPTPVDHDAEVHANIPAGNLKLSDVTSGGRKYTVEFLLQP
jgi:hypothetical protein